MDRARILVADEAARIILDEGVKDYQVAKLKAAERLAFDQRGALPRNTEIEQAVLDRRRLFDPEAHDANLRHLREAALKGMRLFHEYSPRLVGSVLKGTAGLESDVNLHLFADTVEEVIFLLVDAGMPHQSKERRLKIHGAARYYPALFFAADDTQVEAVVFSPDQIRQPPMCPIDGKSMRRATEAQVEALLKEATQE